MIKQEEKIREDGGWGWGGGGVGVGWGINKGKESIPISVGTFFKVYISILSNYPARMGCALHRCNINLPLEADF